ncbi:MAG: DinB family protein [Acidobacteria bacterium]|nr:DinB family protein [Acidobacteriota bacterium]MBV9146808.1 DinB family protein [Acidobacteriota bacterium]MBV9435990.1 DinB family protein [Acidobacteriota bacterium]
MSEGQRMAELYRSIYEGDRQGEAWHGPALKPLLKNVTADQAAQPPKVGSHSILQLVLHMAYWEEVMLRRFNGEDVIAPLNSPDDWPSNRKVTAEEWQAALRRLDSSHHAMRAAIANCPDEKLDQIVPGKNHNFYAVLHGIIHHCVYHSAQAAILKRSLA